MREVFVNLPLVSSKKKDYNTFVVMGRPEKAKPQACESRDPEVTTW